MPAPVNPFKAALKAGNFQLGLWQSIGCAETVEICAGAGFDWLLIDGEHGPNDIRAIRDQVRVVEASPSHPIVRVAEGSKVLVKQAMDVGAQSLLVPMIDTAEQADAMVKATRYPPEGVRGVGAGVVRASDFNRDPDYVQSANDQICLLVQAETVTALENLEAICAVEGVDGVFIGPADLAASMGYPGDATAPAVEAAIEDAIRRIIASGKAAGILMGDEVRAPGYIEMGCMFVAVGNDVALLGSGSTNLAAKYTGAAVVSGKGQVY